MGRAAGTDYLWSRIWVGRLVAPAVLPPVTGPATRSPALPDFRLENTLAPEFVHGVEGEGAGLGDVFETAAERIVVTDGGPIDSGRRVHRRFDILGIHVAVLGPAVIDHIRSRGVGGTDHRSALHSAPGEEGELLRPVVPAAGRGDRADCAAEFADHHDHGARE